MNRNWNNPNPPRPDQIDLACPVDWSHPMAQGLVGYWPLWLGTAVYSAGRDAAHGVYPFTLSQYIPSMVTDRTFGRAVSFNGSNHYLGQNRVIATRGCALVGWFNSASATAVQTILSVRGANNLDGIGLWARGDLAGDPVRGGVFDGATSSGCNSTSGYTVGKWHLGCAVVNPNGSAATYLDGANKGSSANTPNAPNTMYSYIGCELDNAIRAGFFNGLIGMCGAYNRVLTDAEVYNLWHPGRRWSMLRTLTRRTTVIVPAAAGNRRRLLCGAA